MKEDKGASPLGTTLPTPAHILSSQVQSETRVRLLPQLVPPSPAFSESGPATPWKTSTFTFGHLSVKLSRGNALPLRFQNVYMWTVFSSVSTEMPVQCFFQRNVFLLQETLPRPSSHLLKRYVLLLSLSHQVAPSLCPLPPRRDLSTDKWAPPAPILSFLISLTPSHAPCRGPAPVLKTNLVFSRHPQPSRFCSPASACLWSLLAPLSSLPWPLGLPPFIAFLLGCPLLPLLCRCLLPRPSALSQ